MKNRFLFALLVALFSLSVEMNAQISTPQQNSLENLPLTFRQNMGQWSDDILYQGSSPGWGASVYFLKNKLSFGFSRELEEEKSLSVDDPRIAIEISEEEEHLKDSKILEHELEEYERMVWNLEFENANVNSVLKSEGKTDSKVNYLIGNDFSKHRLNVPDYKKLTYLNIYENIDVSYYSNGKKLKYDFIIHQNGKIASIRMKCEGIKSLKITDGNLEIETLWGTLVEKIPESYQIINGQKKSVKIEYQLLDETTFGFKIIGKYDAKQDLIIDPINFEWGTFVGGGPGADGYISEITVDDAGNVYGTGWYNAVFPTTPGVFDPSYNAGGGYGDAYVFKLNATASTLVYCTYIGGASSYEQGQGIDVNAAGEVFVSGWTQSTDFPVTAGCYDNTFAGFQDVFVLNLNATGTALLYSTYIGGTYSDYSYSLELGPTGEAYITGYSGSFDFPVTPGVYDGIANNQDAFVVKLNTTGTNLVFSTYIGGAAPSCIGRGIRVNAAGEAFITGDTYAMDPTPGAYDVTFNSSASFYPDGFIARVSNDGTTLIYNTYIGGDLWDEPYGIAIDANDNAYVTGFTSSTTFPVTAGSYDVTPSTMGDCFIVKINPQGNNLIYGTFFGAGATGYSMGVNDDFELFIAGNVSSDSLYPTACAYDNSFNQGTDCFVGKLNAAGTNAQYASYFGGQGNDYGNGPFGKVKMVLWGECKDEVFVSTTSHSVDFPTTAGTYQSVKLNFGADQPTIFHLKPEITPDFSFVVNTCNNVDFTDETTGNCIWENIPWAPDEWLWDFGDGNTSTLQNPTHTYAAAGTYNVQLLVKCPKDSITIPVTVSSTGLNLSTTSTPASCGSNDGTATVNVIGNPGPFTYLWDNGDTTQTADSLPTGTYNVTVTAGGCTGTASVFVNTTGTLPVTSAITGPNPVCANSVGNVYSVTNTPGSTYVWTVPSGASITAGQGTNSITVNFGASTGVITCTETNACGTGIPVTMNITFTSLPVTSVITGPTPLCEGTTGTIYSVTNNAGSSYLWTVPSGATIVFGQGTNTITVDWGATGGNVSVSETNACGAGVPVSLLVDIHPLPIAAFVPDSTPGCPPWPVNFINQSTVSGTDSIVSWAWLFGDGNNSSLENPTNIYAIGGNYNVTLTVITSAGCSATVTVNNSVNIYPQPNATFTFTPNPIEVGDTVITFIDQSTFNITNWEWNFGDGDSSSLQNPTHTFPGSGIYNVVLTVTNQYGCTDSTILTITLEDEFTFWIPNAITIDGDGLNETFQGYGQNIGDYEMLIFNRWGELIYETDDYYSPWDGTTSKTSPNTVLIDVYVYKITVREAFSLREHVYRGHVSVIK